MMAQYWRIKHAHPDCLLFYRMGDFYELFFEDALQAAKALDITLTKRGRHEGQDIPMCGVPVHAADGYLLRLIRHGFKVAICEQMEDPAVARKRGAKALVERAVVRLVTRGTITEDELLDARAHNYLAALAEAGGALGLAWLDMSTGDFLAQPLGPDAGAAGGAAGGANGPAGGLAAALARLAPGELVLPERLLQRPELFEVLGDWKAALSPLPGARFDSENARRRLEAFYGVKALDAFGAFTRPELAAAGALLDYVELTQKGRLPRLSPLRRVRAGAVMEIDAATRRNLELVSALSGGRRGSLLATIDRTATGAGARLLAARVAAPLTDPAAISARHDTVAFLIEAETLRAELRARLARAPDMERALSRLTLLRGGPRDLAAVRDALGEAGILRGLLAAAGPSAPPEGISSAAKDLGFHDTLVERLTRALGPDLPLNARDGGFIAPGYAPELDEIKTLRDESRRLIAGLQSKYVEATGIPILKIRHNNVLGYYIEVSAAQAENMPGGADSPFIHRQTMANAVRYATVELSELEQKISSAAERALALEVKLFDDLVAEVDARAEEIGLAARALARLDVAAALAEVAVQGRWCRPKVDDSTAFEVTGGRHPVVEAALATAQQGGFVANDCDLAEAGRIWLVTGPNMAGKSTFLRQNALIAVLAQMGAYVPAQTAHIGVVDRLFSRVGAADDLARGRSTFMVEMVESAVILNQAGPRALVILDEIGRGTATFDGLSIAWACVEHLHEVNRCRALFATHFHELTALAGKLDALSCHTMRVKEWKSEVVFLHEVAPGAADRSYGIHVAKLAGLPEPVIARAEEVLSILEQGEQAGALARLADDLPLFSAAPPAAAPAAPGPSALEARLAEVNPDDLTPKAALELLYELRALMNAKD
ncbi:MAG: DNA mismatch repair protein MutS [Proteobacteria bacterium]|nr:DNA mismatch repair protein MutS [Pseudomonadota bacterium]